MNYLSDDKFECQKIKSPLKELQDEETKMIQKNQKVKQELDSLTEALNKELKDIEEQLNWW